MLLRETIVVLNFSISTIDLHFVWLFLSLRSKRFKKFLCTSTLRDSKIWRDVITLRDSIPWIPKSKRTTQREVWLCKITRLASEQPVLLYSACSNQGLLTLRAYIFYNIYWDKMPTRKILERKIMKAVKLTKWPAKFRKVKLSERHRYAGKCVNRNQNIGKWHFCQSNNVNIRSRMINLKCIKCRRIKVKKSAVWYHLYYQNVVSWS